MNLAAVISIVAAAIEGVMAILALLLARAPGWRHLRIFGLVALSACAYSAINLAFSLQGLPDDAILWALRLNYLAACVHCAAWLIYCNIQYGQSVGRGDRWAITGLALMGLLGLVPGVLTTDQIHVQTVDWAGVTYRTPAATALGSVLMAIAPIVLSVPLVRYYRRARQGVAGARWHFLAFCGFFSFAVAEVLVTVGSLETVYLADVGFLIAVLSVLSEMAHRVASDAEGLLALSTDLSYQVEERTRELLETREGLLRAERLGALGRLSASVGHEINNPLSYIVGNLDYALAQLEHVGGGQPILDALTDARGGAERIGRIVRELRVFGRGSPEPQLELTDPSDALESALRLAGNEISCRARLERDLQSLPRVWADPHQLTQVFVNVLLNAAQAIPEEHGRSGVSVISLRSRCSAHGEVSIEVTDTGRGISEQDHKRLFEPFFSTKPQGQGTGLGLFVSRGIITSFDGRIEVDSTLGVGTTVRIVLPPAPARAPLSVPPSRPSVAVRSRRLLVVDDDVLVARTLARLLQGHHVEIAKSGQSALRRLLESDATFDLVLCDLMMPDMTGMELFEEIQRREPPLADRFLFISGGGVTDSSRQFIEHHKDRVLAKPIDLQAVMRVLSRRARDATGGGPRTSQSAA